MHGNSDISIDGPVIGCVSVSNLNIAAAEHVDLGEVTSLNTFKEICTLREKWFGIGSDFQDCLF